MKFLCIQTFAVSFQLDCGTNRLYSITIFLVFSSFPVLWCYFLWYIFLKADALQFIKRVYLEKRSSSFKGETITTKNWLTSYMIIGEANNNRYSFSLNSDKPRTPRLRLWLGLRHTGDQVRDPEHWVAATTICMRCGIIVYVMIPQLKKSKRILCNVFAMIISH